MMANKFDRFLRDLAQAGKFEQIQDLTLTLRDLLEVDHVAYHWVSSVGEQYGYGSYSLAWIERYFEKEYLRIDPVIIGCFQRFHPVDWKRLDWSSKAARAFREDAIAHGVGNQGYSIPVRGPNGQFALFSVSHNCTDDEWMTFTQKNKRNLILISHYLNQKALELEKDRKPEPARPLSPREVDALTFLAMGYGRGQVAEMLSISEHTLRAYIESARFKLGAMNTTHAVARALNEGLIIIGGAAREAAGSWPGRSVAPVAE